jgi:hypothetical protein
VRAIAPLAHLSQRRIPGLPTVLSGSLAVGGIVRAQVDDQGVVLDELPDSDLKNIL